jgi:DNA-binding beta-propeller fold protein YncE
MNRSLCAPLAAFATVLVLLLADGCGTAPKGAAAPPVNGTYAFWPTFPDDPHIQFVRGFNTSDDVAPKQASGLEKIVFGQELEKGAAVNKPYGVAMRHGRIYVADIRNNQVVVLDLKKKQTRLIGASGINQLKRPVAVAVAEDSTLYVADIGRGAVMVYDPSERYTSAYGHPNLKPSSLAVSGDRLYVTDMTSQKAEIYDRNSGKMLAAVGSVGDEDGQFRLPLGVAADKAGNIYVMDMMRCRLQKFSPDGKFVGAVGAIGMVAGTFARPKHLAVDSDGTVYVVDAAFQNVQMFDDKFELLMHFGAAGEFPGAMNLPAGICVSDDPEDLALFRSFVHPGFEPKRVIAVTNQFGDCKVAVYVEGDLKQGYTAQDLAKVAAAVKPGTGVPTAEEVKLSAPGSEEPLTVPRSGQQPAPPGDGAPPTPPPGGGAPQPAKDAPPEQVPPK